PLLPYQVRVHAKNLGPKLGKQLEEARRALAAADPAVVAERVLTGEPFELDLPDSSVLLGPSDLVIDVQEPEGWAGLANRGTQLALDTRITESLKGEGWAREIVRHVQELRKTAGLQMEDRIELSLQTASKDLRKAITKHRDYICRE